MPVYAGQRVTAGTLNALPGDIVTLTTGNTVNSSTEVTIGTFSACIPANDAVVNGGYRWLIFGSTDTTGTPTIRFRFYVGSAAGANLIFDSGSGTTNGAATNKPWSILAWMMVITTGTTGTFEGFGLANSAHINASPLTNNNHASTINTTVSNDVIVTAQWGTANASNNCRTLAGSAQRT